MNYVCDKMSTIKGVDVYSFSTPLVSPYILSFTTVTHLDSIIVKVSLADGRWALGEASPLQGYSLDTIETILSIIKDLAPRLCGYDWSQSKAFLDSYKPETMFGLSAIYSATELAFSIFDMPTEIQLPLLAPVSSQVDQKDLVSKARLLYRSGFNTLKLKVGRDIEMDLLSVRNILDEFSGEKIKIRIDANQAYIYQDAVALFASISSHPGRDIIECVEQPMAVDAWELTKKLVSKYPEVPLMLDEAIVNKKDIIRAFDVGARLVKLKLFKHRGISEVCYLASVASELGMKVVLGNGVSSDVGNLAEAIAYIQGTFFGAFEGNGFSKINQMATVNSPIIEKGCLKWVASTEAKEWKLQSSSCSLICSFK